MDIPVVLIKLRDYLLWFGPAYLIAIGLGAASEVVIRRLLARYPATAEAPRKSTHAASTPLTSVEPNLVLVVWLRIVGRLDPPHCVPLQLYLWASIWAQSVSWLPLLVTAQLGWALSILRLGFALIMASLLAALVPLIVPGGRALSIEIAHVDEGLPAPMPPIEWWRAFQRRFNESSNGLALAAGLGALLFGLTPELYSVLRAIFTVPLSYVSGAVLGILTPFVPGTEAPLVAALQTKGVGPGAIIAFMLAVSAMPWGLLRDMKRSFGPRALAIYLLAASLLAALIGALAEPILTAVGGV